MAIVQAHIPCMNEKTGKREQHTITVTEGRLRTQCSKNQCRFLMEDWRLMLGQISNPRICSGDPEKIQTRYPKKLRPIFIEACKKARSRRDYKREALERAAELRLRTETSYDPLLDQKVILPMGMLTRGNGFGPRGFSDSGNCNANEWRVFIRDILPEYSIYTRGNRGFPDHLPESMKESRKENNNRYRYWRKYPRLFRSWEKMMKLEGLIGEDIPQECVDRILPGVDGYEVPYLGNVGIEIKKIFSQKRAHSDVLVYFEGGFVTGRQTCMVRFSRKDGKLKVDILDEV